MEVAGKIIELNGSPEDFLFISLRVNWFSWILPKANTVEGDIEMTFSPNSWHLLRHATEVACQHANRTEAARCFSPAKKEQKHNPSIVEAVWPFTPYRHGIIVIICNILVLNVGNFREWSIITSNHPSNPQQPIHSLRKTHQEVTCCGQELSEHHLGALGWSSR